MEVLNLLYKDRVSINKKINIVIPKVGDIIPQQDNYYDLVSLITAMPIDLMIFLEDLGIDFTTITPYEMFLRVVFPILYNKDTSLIFGDLDLSVFEYRINEDNGDIVLLDTIHDIKIDKEIYNNIATVLRKIHHYEKSRQKPANEEAKKYLLERAREKMMRNRRRKQDSQLESLIVAMVNTEQYKYDFEGTRELSIYQFNESVRQIINKVDYDNKMYGVYSGTVDVKSLSQDDLNWLKHK